MPPGTPQFCITDWLVSPPDIHWLPAGGTIMQTGTIWPGTDEPSMPPPECPPETMVEGPCGCAIIMSILPATVGPAVASPQTCHPGFDPSGHSQDTSSVPAAPSLMPSSRWVPADLGAAITAKTAAPARRALAAPAAAAAAAVAAPVSPRLCRGARGLPPSVHRMLPCGAAAGRAAAVLEATAPPLRPEATAVVGATALNLLQAAQAAQGVSAVVLRVALACLHVVQRVARRSLDVLAQVHQSLGDQILEAVDNQAAWLHTQRNPCFLRQDL
eukprot:CAMPEP_0177175530 /NCGR_PEP_ID=MMETSP0367-20130122/12759_1 /TAXON_ID=447022 ORGANISM="Scrippsiella hangoei-like, Strain SHHI-4" /NCGR_SAMPLE_ID=MMETSP0367 /ASSEMBLY_ACC=CAM_ASM_000362 /LENGTH=271 /DNA_ID=CAMNT_0018621957 /DNA_START=519 /DNA_END=1336 /DNA_ORIENTATION=-